MNREEAEAVAEIVKRRLKAWLSVPEDERPTLGVITLNAEQQSLILDLLDEIRRGDSALEWFFADEREEPVIVKNLENIQGDERDVMLFSVTFGADLAGKVTMNFGAINGTGGEKRLNVAITRARREFHVFTSIRAEQIDLDRSRAVGVRDLKAFLDYAERGSAALPARDEGSLGPAESPFEEAVAAVLRAKGWEIRTQIGVSGFRVDLGVVHPDFAGSFIAGIECDGARYHSSATARDRDKVRQAVLEGLGWKILRVWSTDWFRNPSAVADRLQLDLKQLLERDRQVRATATDQADEPAAEIESRRKPEDVPDTIRLPPSHAEDAEVAKDRAATSHGGEKPSRLIEDVEGPRSTALPTDTEAGSEGFALPVTAAPVSQMRSNADTVVPSSAGDFGSTQQQDVTPDPDRFFDEQYAPTLRRLIRRIVDREGPIPMHGLARRVAQEHGWQRTGKRIQARVQSNLSLVECHPEFRVDFVWAPGSHSDWVPFRGLNGRPIRDISRAEIGSVIDTLARALANEEDPILALSRRLGIARLSKDARAYLSDCVEWGRENGTPVLPTEE